MELIQLMDRNRECWDDQNLINAGKLFLWLLERAVHFPEILLLTLLT